VCSVAAFRASHAGLCGELAALARDVQADQQLSDLIRAKYRIKCTTGYAGRERERMCVMLTAGEIRYSLNALTDFTDPIDILKACSSLLCCCLCRLTCLSVQHIMIGSEGTLGTTITTASCSHTLT
jgi:D-lactate dehydrogenase